MTDILITGEGPADYGWKSFGSDNWHEGAAAILLRRCAEAKLREKETVMNLISISPIARMWRLLSCNEVSITIVLKAKAFLLSDFTC